MSALYPDQCPVCLGSGYKGWKTPDNYPLAQVDFCQCPRGIAAHAYWDKKAAERERSRLASLFTLAGVPAKYRGVTLESSRPVALADKGKIAAFRAAEEFVGNGYVENRGKARKSLLFSGVVGTGKTHILTAVLNHFLADGLTCLWIEFYDFTDEVQSGYKTGESSSRIKAAVDADVLMLDDLGKSERNHPQLGFSETEDKTDILSRVINARYNANRTTLISTNLRPEQIAQQFNVRTMDRLMEMCGIYAVAGKNLRE